MKSIALFITSVFFIAAVTGQDGLNEAQQKCLTDAGGAQSEDKCQSAPSLGKCLLRASYDKRPDAEQLKEIRGFVNIIPQLKDCNLDLDRLIDEVYNGASRHTVAATFYAMIAILTFFLARAV